MVDMQAAPAAAVKRHVDGATLGGDMTTKLLASPPPVRTIGDDDLATARPIYVVWELTMKCDQPCQHCGSRAGHAREDELGTEEILEVARGLVRLGTRE